MYPTLPKSYKAAFPFKIGTTSFIYPDGYVQNVKMLGPYLDEIELLLFESNPNSWPSDHEIKELFSLSNDYDFSYNIHLPLDLSLGAPETSARHHAIETIKQIMCLASPLSPSTYTLHLIYDENDFEHDQINRWKERAYHSMNTLCSYGFNSRSLSIETLNYPLEWIEEIIIDFNLSVCMDLGHLILYGMDLQNVFNRHKTRTSIIHLHGANERQDHQSLDVLSKSNLNMVLKILKQFIGIVSIEVFSFGYLSFSLECLEHVWIKLGV